MKGLREALEDMAADVPTYGDLDLAFEQVAQQRWQRIRTVAGPAAAAAVVALVLGALASTREDGDAGRPVGPPALSTPAEPAPAPLTAPLEAPASLLDVRELGFRVDPIPGFTPVDGWELTRDFQRVTVAPKEGGQPLVVSVRYEGAPPPVPTGSRGAVTVHGVRGTYSEDVRADEWLASLIWEYAPDAWAEVSWRGITAAPPDRRETIVTVAEAVRPGGGPVRVPVGFGTLPSAVPSPMSPRSMVLTVDAEGWFWTADLGDLSVWARSGGAGLCGDGGARSVEPFTYRGNPGCLVDDTRLVLRLGAAETWIDFDPASRPPLPEMKRLLSELTLGSQDRTSWFDLASALED